MGYENRASAALRYETGAMTGGQTAVGIWRQVRATLRKEFGDIVYASEIARLRVTEDGAGQVCIICPNDFSRSWVEDHLGARLRALWAAAEDAARDILIATEAGAAAAARRSTPSPAAPVHVAAVPAGARDSGDRKSVV